MSPYFAVITDSFRSALASRVLWAAFLAIWVLLATLAPIGLREDYTTTFRWFDVHNGTRMKIMLAEGLTAADAEERPAGRIAAAMPEELQRQLRRVKQGNEVRIRLNLLTDALNDLIESDSAKTERDGAHSTADAPTEPPAFAWYDADAWSSTVRLRELRQLDETADSELSDSLRQRRSRLRIEAALPGVFESRSVRSILLTYAGLEFPTDFQIDRAQFDTLFNQFVIPLLVNWLLGLVLVFLGVLVTASIIPDMLQAGSLHLLLSKPISRSGLLISKFIGGCAFVTLCVSQLVLGLYLIAGGRLGVWNGRILWCIPIAVVIFAVFFSVSVLAGLKWRSSIISIAAAGALAAVCMVVGIVGGVVNARVVEPDRIVGMTTAGDDLFAVTGGSGLTRFSPASNQWMPLIESEAGSRDRVLQPVALGTDHVMTARIRNGRFNPFGSGSLDLVILSRRHDWKPQPSVRLPDATERLLRLDEQSIAALSSADILVSDQSSILTAIGEEPLTSPGESQADQPTGSTSEARAARTDGSIRSWFQSLLTPQGEAASSFLSILPPDVVLSPPSRVVQVAGERSLILLTTDRLQRISAENGGGNSQWATTDQTALPRAEDRAPPVVAASQRWVVLAQGDLPVRIFDAVSLEPTGQWDTEAREPDVPGTPLELIAISDDCFLIRTSSGHCDVVEVTGSTVNHLAELPIDEIESVHWQPEALRSGAAAGTLTVAHDVDRITQFSIERPGGSSDELRIVKADSVAPSLSIWRWVDFYVVGALEWLTPQVVQLGDTSAAMVSGNDSLVIGDGESGTPEVVRYRIAAPLASCGIFIAAMLLISCVYFSRSDY
ncbi:ABC transporter permease [Allorhodopirellula solitaria]|uniref:ABC-2 family transporter protein n=1 Tax=Allorhodopirellula solitaria TaxID=2527987 RepID=A0A5C5XPN7_9BACT|nr:ABC transporter permease [Allorhodopirellula solitaria]TWT65137.1 ABC-2 family transporter protein [Allorhodopirellula solitaria]